MTASDMNNGVNRVAVFDEGTSTSRVAEGQQPLNPAFILQLLLKRVD